MEMLTAFGVTKPEFLSGIALRTRLGMSVISLSGKGDPQKTFDEAEKKLYIWLKNKGVKSVGPAFGIYYLDREKVGVENVEWDACVQVEKPIETEGDIRFQILPQRRVISTTLTGGYDLIGPALKYLEQVALANEINIRRPLTEIYLKEGGKVPVTELQYFVEEKK